MGPDHNWCYNCGRDDLGEAKGCPCVYTTPCDENCTCVKPLSSLGCRRCCSYGSLAQRQGAAERLAAITKERDAALQRAEAAEARLAHLSSKSQE